MAADGIDRPFIRNADGSYTLKPGFSDATRTAAVTFAAGITSAGLLAGSYTFDPNGATGFIGYILNGNNFITTFSAPGASATFALDNNDAGRACAEVARIFWAPRVASWKAGLGGLLLFHPRIADRRRTASGR